MAENKRALAKRRIDEFVQRVGDRMDSVVNAMTGLGGSHDKGTQVAVDTNRTPLDQGERDALAKYNGYIVSWLARLSGEATLTGWDVKSGADKLPGFRPMERRLQVNKKFRLAAQFAAKDGGSLILVVTKGGGSLRTPIRLKRVKDILALHVFDSQEFQAHQYESDWKSTNYRRPKTWMLNPSSNAVARGKMLTGELVHHSRCIYIPGRELSDRERAYSMDPGKDASYLDAVWDAVKDISQVDQGAAVLAQEMKETIIRVAGLEALEAGALADAFRARMQTIAMGRGLLGMTVLAEDDVYESRATSAVGYKDLKGGAKTTLAAQTDQPEVVAFGATPGGLNTDGEAGRRSQDRTVARFQKVALLNGLEHFYTIAIAALASQGTTIAEDWEVVFRELGTQTLQEKAETRNKNAQTDRIYRQEGILPPKHIQESRFGEDGYGDIRPVPKETEVPGDPTRAFGGPQGAAVAQIVKDVSMKLLPREAGIAQMVHVYNFPQPAAEAMMGEAGTSFFVELPEPAPAGGAPTEKGGGDDE